MSFKRFIRYGSDILALEDILKDIKDNEAELVSLILLREVINFMFYLSNISGSTSLITVISLESPISSAVCCCFFSLYVINKVLLVQIICLTKILKAEITMHLLFI